MCWNKIVAHVYFQRFKNISCIVHSSKCDSLHEILGTYKNIWKKKTKIKIMKYEPNVVKRTKSESQQNQVFQSECQAVLRHEW